jgi:hypothetical protein
MRARDRAALIAEIKSKATSWTSGDTQAMANKYQIHPSTVSAYVRRVRYPIQAELDRELFDRVCAEIGFTPSGASPR